MQESIEKAIDNCVFAKMRDNFAKNFGICIPRKYGNVQRGINFLSRSAEKHRRGERLVFCKIYPSGRKRRGIAFQMFRKVD